MSRRSAQDPRNTQRRIFPRVLRVLRCTSFSVVLAASTPQTDTSITVVLTDHHFRLSAPVERGPLLWHIRNEGSEPHQALVVKLPAGVSEFGEMAWFEHGSKGPEPGERAGGIETVAPGAEASFRTALEPGRYLLLCAMSEDEGRHYDLGMIYRFEVE
jgi:hypothetical protein